MKVLLLAHYLPPHQGGVEVLVDREARLLAAAGHEVVLLASDAGQGEPPRYPAGVRVCRVRCWNGLERRCHVPWPVFAPSLLPLLWRYLRWCDVAHVNGLLYLNSFLTLVLARALGKPTVLTEHIGLAWYPPGLKRATQWAAMASLGRLAARLAGRCIGYHERVVALLRRLAGPRRWVSYLCNPLERGLFRPPTEEERRQARAALGWDDGRPRVLFVGRIIPRKGIDLLLRARDPQLELVFCGPGDPSLLGDLQGGSRYLPPRSRADLVRLYHAADVLAQPSRSEGGLVLVAQEALACGLPVLLGEDAGLARYRRCAGLHFAPLAPEAIRGTLLEILRRRPAPITPMPGEAPLDSFCPDDATWLQALYEPPPSCPAGPPPLRRRGRARAENDGKARARLVHRPAL
jgi:D-inositol-3-phosphate glycosyltransferase